jgi:hypothetical protein
MNVILQSSRTGSVQTSASGTAFVNLGDQAAHEVQIINASGTSIDVKTDGSAVAVPIASGTNLTLGLGGNISEISVKRTDSSVTQVFVHFVSAKAQVAQR